MRTTFVCLAALAQLALSAFAEPEPYKIPLYARSSDGGIVKAAGEELKDGVLAGKVEIGNPPQQFTLAFDTTTGYSWVRGSRCKSENCLDRCTYYARRSDSAVSTGKKFSVDYGDACVDTHVYTDTFRFAGLTVDDMPFGGAYRMSGFDTGFDGYLGLGRAVNWNETKVHSNLMRRDPMSSSAFVSNAYQSGSGLQSSQFGMYTTDSSSSSGGNSGFDQSGSGNSNSGSTTGSTTGTTNSGSTTGSTTGSTANGGNPAASGAASSGAPASSGVAPAGSSGAASSGVAPAASNSAAPAPSAQPSSTDSNGDGSSSSGVTSGGFGFQKRHNTEEEPAGYLILGGVDKSMIKGDVNYIALADPEEGSQRNWDVCIKDAVFEGDLSIKQKENAIAAITTSTNYITMPSDQADLFEKKYCLKYYQTTQTYGIKCSEAEKLPPLKLTLEDHIVELPAKYWIRTVDADRDCCATRIRRGESTRDWQLGTAFTNAFYTTFDPDGERIGLGIKKGHNDDGLKIYKKSD
ncbi:aspartic peptidase domain-containing protein [Syncephalastrum racemosum]|uniref:Aspartic peptidase domain-containing protein n=1 Tax=Syncephalastrum racemosum TaxID=13706 RepID=A0A1X2HD74_SYNRA|nr:aspartic peptidase domain-containing protein [Syncephalastrum racemosum]